jgi:integrase
MRSNSRAAEAKVKNGRVIIRLPRNWFSGKQKEFSLGIPSNPENLTYGRSIATQINADHRLGKFDASLAKYKEQPEQPSEPLAVLTLSQLWGKYCEYKAPRWKAKTAHYNVTAIGQWIEKLPVPWSDALSVRSYLLRSTTNGMVIRVLASVESCLDWAMRIGILEQQRNPYRRMGSDLKSKTDRAAGANALSQSEQERLIRAFYDHPLWDCYGAFVEFLFLTGCRPSEAVGLDWEQVASDFSTIRFDRSVVRIGTKIHKNKLSKTNRSRVFYCNERLSALLLKLFHTRTQSGAVFLVRGKLINYETVSKKPWKTLSIEVTGRATTPYSARDTFISHQTESGKPIALIAQWVDNSSAMIEKKYLDTSVTQSIMPD